MSATALSCFASDTVHFSVHPYNICRKASAHLYGDQNFKNHNRQTGIFFCIWDLNQQETVQRHFIYIYINIAPRIPVKMAGPKNFGRRLKINPTLKSLNSYHL